MKVKEAVEIAANYVAELESFSLAEKSDIPSPMVLAKIDFAIEGTRYSGEKGAWEIEVGFVRPWDRGRPSALAGLAAQSVGSGNKRTYKRVLISDSDGEVLSYGSSGNN